MGDVGREGCCILVVLFSTPCCARPWSTRSRRLCAPVEPDPRRLRWEGRPVRHEVHLSEIAYDYWSSARALEQIEHREGYWDPSHIMSQNVDPVGFNADGIYHADCKDARVRPANERSDVVGSLNGACARVGACQHHPRAVLSCGTSRGSAPRWPGTLRCDVCDRVSERKLRRRGSGGRLGSRPLRSLPRLRSHRTPTA